MLARGRGAWFKNTLFVAAAKAAGSIVSIPQKASSAYCAVLNHEAATGSQTFVTFIYNAAAQA